MTNPFVIDKIADAATGFAARHYPFARAEDLQQALARTFSRYLGNHRSGARFEAEGLLVTGPTGAGKSTEIENLINMFHDSNAALSDGTVARIISCNLDAKDGWKSLGTKTLEALGYKLADTARNTQQQIWRKVVLQAKAQGVVCIHYDEAQHIFRGKSDTERLSILDSFKTLLKSRDWPLMLILSGMPELAGQVREEPQLFRLLTQVEMQDIVVPRDFQILHELVSSYAIRAGLPVADDLASEDFYERLATAAGFRWGLAIVIAQHAVGEAIVANAPSLSIGHFIEAWTRKTRMVPIASPFLHDRYATAFPRDRLFWSNREIG